MSFVSQISEEQAGPELKAIYRKIRAGWNFIPNYWLAQGRRPDLIRAQMELGAAISQEGALPRQIKEQVGLVVAGINTSSYCVALHMELLHNLGIEKPLGRKLAVDYANAPVEEKVKALFRFADKLTRKPGDMAREDIEELKRAGWNEEQIYETVLTVGLMNFYNRVSLGLGLVADF
jgi:uncharacterized peroxidase-related enzyme